jgi:hypothetical protein
LSINPPPPPPPPQSLETKSPTEEDTVGHGSLTSTQNQASGSSVPHIQILALTFEGQEQPTKGQAVDSCQPTKGQLSACLAHGALQRSRSCAQHRPGARPANPTRGLLEGGVSTLGERLQDRVLVLGLVNRNSHLHHTSHTDASCTEHSAF